MEDSFILSPHFIMDWHYLVEPTEQSQKYTKIFNDNTVDDIPHRILLGG